MRRVKRRVWPALVVALVATVAPGWVRPAAGASVVTVSPGYDQRFAPGRAFPVRVSVQVDRLVRGSVVVTSRMGDGRRSQVSLPVEVPGGSAKEFLLVVPPQVSFDGAGPVVTATLRDRSGGQLAASASAGLRHSDDELVGLLPGALAGRPAPAPATLAVEAGVARFVPVGADELAHAPFSLEPLGSLGVADGELSRLAPSARAGILRWVAAGGHLLVDSPTGTTVEGLPDPWQPGPEGRAPAGRGEVVATAGAMAAGRWAGLVEPTAASPSSGLEFAGESVGNSLARDAGLRVPDLGWLLGFLLVYVAVVGPGTAFVLRRRGRPELAWVVIPLVAVLFTTGSYVGGKGLRSGVRLASATAVELSDVRASATSYVGVAARSARTAEVAFGASSLAWPNASFSGLDSAVSASEMTGDGLAARLALDAGEFGVVRGDGPLEVAGALELEATSDGDGRAGGTVTNRLPFALHEVVVLVAGSGVQVGSLDPGERRPWSLDAGRAGGPREQFGPVELDLWRHHDFDPTRPVDLALWQSTSVSSDPGSRGPGVALVVGWTRDLQPSLTVDGDPRRTVARTAVIGRAPVKPSGAVLTDMTIRREVVRGALMGPFRQGPVVFDGFAGSATVARFTLPSGAEARPLLARLPADAVAEAWIDGSWTPLQPVGGVIARPAGRLREARPLPLPAETVPPAPAPVPVRPAVGGPPTTVVVPPPSALDDEVAFLGGALRDHGVPAVAVRGGRVFLRVRPGPSGTHVDSSFTLREAP